MARKRGSRVDVVRVAPGVLATGGGLLLPALAEAHSGAADPGLGLVALPGLLGLGLAGALVATPRGSRRWRLGALCLAALLLLLAAERSVHGVHHLPDPADAGRCQVLKVSQHLSCDVADAGPPAVGVWSWQAVASSVVASPAQGPVVRPDRGRAPPHPTS